MDQELKFVGIGKVFEIAYMDPPNERGWATFVIRHEGERGFKAGYSVIEDRFAQGWEFTRLHPGTRADALAFARAQLEDLPPHPARDESTRSARGHVETGGTA